MRSEGFFESLVHFKPNFRQWHQLFEHRFFWQPHLTNWTIASEAGASFVITGIHLSSLFSHLNPPGCGKLGQHTYHRSKLSFNRGRGELLHKVLLVLVEAWPIPHDFFSTYAILVPWLVRYWFYADKAAVAYKFIHKGQYLVSGEPNDGFLLNTLKTLFRLVSRVLLDL